MASLSRTQAGRKGRDRSPCLPGGKREALLASVGCNATHGLRRCRATKRKAVLTLLNDPVWRTWSSQTIAHKCAVSAAFVSQLRNAQAADNPECSPAERTYIINGRQVTGSVSNGSRTGRQSGKQLVGGRVEGAVTLLRNKIAVFRKHWSATNDSVRAAFLDTEGVRIADGRVWVAVGDAPLLADLLPAGCAD